MSCILLCRKLRMHEQPFIYPVSRNEFLRDIPPRNFYLGYKPYPTVVYFRSFYSIIMLQHVLSYEWALAWAAQLEFFGIVAEIIFPVMVRQSAVTKTRKLRTLYCRKTNGITIDIWLRVFKPSWTVDLKFQLVAIYPLKCSDSLKYFRSTETCSKWLVIKGKFIFEFVICFVADGRKVWINAETAFDMLTHRDRDKWPPFSRRHCQMHFLEWNVKLSITISLELVPKGKMTHISALVQMIAWDAYMHLFVTK